MLQEGQFKAARWAGSHFVCSKTIIVAQIVGTKKEEIHKWGL